MTRFMLGVLWRTAVHHIKRKMVGFISNCETHIYYNRYCLHCYNALETKQELPEVRGYHASYVAGDFAYTEHVPIFYDSTCLTCCKIALALSWPWNE